jgi:hypothetical protein
MSVIRAVGAFPVSPGVADFAGTRIPICGSVAGSRAAAGLEESLWLCPIEDRRQLDAAREGMLEGFSLGNYLLLVDYTGRLFRKGKGSSTGWRSPLTPGACGWKSCAVAGYIAGFLRRLANG